jgi:hypothetical protein
MEGKHKQKTSGTYTAKLITPARVAIPVKKQGVDPTPMLATGMRAQFEKLNYPIANQAELIAAFRQVSRIPVSFFPIRSAADFESKIGYLFQPAASAASATLYHPTSLTPPSKAAGQ